MCILIVYLLDDLEWSMTLAIYFKDFLPILERRAFFLDFHAVVGSFGTLDVELDIAIRFVALDHSSYVDAFLATDYTAVVEFRKVELIHLHWLPRCHDWTRHPHGATMMSPMVESVSNWRRTALEQGLIPLQKVAIVLRNRVIGPLVLIEIEFKFFFLVLNQFLGFCELRNHLMTLLGGYLDIVESLQVIIEDCPLVQAFPLE